MQSRKKKKIGVQIEKEEVTLSLFADMMIDVKKKKVNGIHTKILLELKIELQRYQYKRYINTKISYSSKHH